MTFWPCSVTSRSAPPVWGRSFVTDLSDIKLNMWERSELAAGIVGESEDLTGSMYVVYMLYVRTGMSVCEFIVTHFVRERKPERKSRLE
jgi:hypothetical protein